MTEPYKENLNATSLLTTNIFNVSVLATPIKNLKNVNKPFPPLFTKVVAVAAKYL